MSEPGGAWTGGGGGGGRVRSERGVGGGGGGKVLYGAVIFTFERTNGSTLQPHKIEEQQQQHSTQTSYAGCSETPPATILRSQTLDGARSLHGDVL